MTIRVNCPFNPTIYKNEPIGMFHCPWCGEMVMAGMEHVDYGKIEFEEEEYNELVDNMKEVMDDYLAKEDNNEVSNL